MWLVSGDRVAGPGGQEFFTDGDGALGMIFRGWSANVIGYDQSGFRSLYTSESFSSTADP